MRDFLIIDTETTCVDPAEGHLLEVAAVLFDPGMGIATRTYAALVAAEIEVNEARAINRIPAAAVWPGPSATSRREVIDRVRQMARDGAPYILAHNAAFDRGWLPEMDGDWICTKEDAEWPMMPGGTGSLVNIALAYGLGVARAHRAVEDCLTLAALLTRVHELEGGLDAWLARALEERVEMRSRQAFEENHLAKAAGFRWDPERRGWFRRVRVSQAEAFVAGLPFGVSR